MTTLASIRARIKVLQTEQARRGRPVTQMRDADLDAELEEHLAVLDADLRIRPSIGDTVFVDKPPQALTDDELIGNILALLRGA